jgi:DNA-binding CsgD family transcriptional regulator
MLQDGRINELVRLIYAAAADPAQWGSFLGKFAEALRAQSAVFLIHDLKSGQATGSTIGNDPSWLRPYETYYASKNVWLERGMEIWQPGVVESSEAIIEDRELVRTEFYNDFLRPQDWFYSCGGIASREESTLSYVSALRSKSSGTFTSDELAVFQFLVPHLRTAVVIHGRIAGLEADLRTATSALDHFSTSVLVVDSNFQVTFLNRAAEALLQSRDGLRLLADGLRASRREDSERLRNRIAAVANAANAAAQPARQAIFISRPSGRRPLEVLVAPLPEQSVLGNRRRAAALFITDPEQQVEPVAAPLRELFGFTPAEVRLANALLQGKSVEEYAEESAVSINTARTHVKRIYSKAGVKRQSELVRLLFNSFGPLRRNNGDR